MSEDIFTEIEQLHVPRAPLSKEEESRILSRVISEAPPKEAVKKKYRFTAFIKTASALAACLLLLVGVNVINPVFAEKIPLIGSVFSWFNQTAEEGKRSLKSDKLEEVAVPINQPAEALAECPYTMEINEVYCDGIYLRFTSTITAPDDSLAAYGFLVTEQQWGEENPLNLGVTNLDTGERLGPDEISPWEKIDDRTFINELKIDLARWGKLPETLRIGFTSGSIATYHPEDSLQTREAYDANKFVVNAGGYTADFDVQVDETLTRRGAAQTMNDIELSNVTATAGETRVEYKLPSEEYEGVVFIVKTADGQKVQPAGGQNDYQDGFTIGYCDYDAVPEDCSTLYVTAFNKNTDEALAEFTVELE